MHSSPRAEFALRGTGSLSAEPAIDRAKTALSRNNFSRPVQHLLETGLLTKRRSLFDYGCGRGDDIAGLAEIGFKASGWDPGYQSSSQTEPADIVNLGFVLNVIEDAKERSHALRRAWELAERALIVTVISVWERPANGLSEYSDGHVTQRGTFQRYYEPGEIKEYVDELLGVDSIPVSPVCVVCFRDPEVEQEYLARRSSAVRSAIPAPRHPLKRSRLNQCIERFRTEHADEWDELARSVLEYASGPSTAMVAVHEELASCGVQAAEVRAAIVDMVGEDEWNALAERVRNTLIARVALGFFRGKPKPKSFPRAERDAVKEHFGTFGTATDLAHATLFSIGNPEVIARECGATSVGHEDEQALFVHRSCLPYLSAVLQTYIGVGSLFYGELDDVDVFKIHKASGKLTLLLYDDYEGKDEPILQTRVKISFRERRVDYFDHRREQQALHDKHPLGCLPPEP